MDYAEKKSAVHASAARNIGDEPEVYDTSKSNAADRRDMTRMGKSQEMRRNFGNWTMFSFSVVLMASWEVILSTASLGLGNGGSAGLLYTNLATWIGFLAVYASLGDQGSMAPTSGGQYHWVSEFSPRRYQKFMSYVIGWLGVLGWQAGVAFAAFVTGTQIQGLLVLNYPWYIYQAWHGSLLIIATLVFAVIFNTFLAQQLHLIEGAVLFLHTLGFIAIIATLWATSPIGRSAEVWTTFYDPGWGNQGLSCLIGIVASVAPLLGADAAAHMAEELKDASYSLPRVIVWATFINGGMMFVMCITICYCIGDLGSVLGTKTEYPFIQLFYNSTGSLAVANTLTAIVIIMSGFSCLTVMAGSSRQLFAFARDRGVPFSGWVSHVRPGFDVPVNAILVIFTFAALIALINIGSTVAFNIVTSLGTGTLTLSYIVCISCVIWRKLFDKPLLPGRFDMGPIFGLTVNIVAVAWLCLVLVIAFFPSVPEPLLTLKYMNWSVVVWGAVIVFSILYFGLWARKTYVGPVEYVRVLD